MCPDKSIVDACEQVEAMVTPALARLKAAADDAIDKAYENARASRRQKQERGLTRIATSVPELPSGLTAKFAAYRG